MHAKLKSYLKTKILGFIRSIELEQRNKWGPVMGARLAITTAPGDMDVLTAEAVRCLALPPPQSAYPLTHATGLVPHGAVFSGTRVTGGGGRD